MVIIGGFVDEIGVRGNIIREFFTTIIETSRATPPTPFFIHADSTPTDEDGGPYTDLSKILPANANVTTAIYFGSANPGGTPLQKTDTNGIVVSVLIVLFGYEDRDGSGTNNAGDTNYGQTIPFQAYRLHD